MPLKFTTLDLQAAVDPLFDQCIKQVAATQDAGSQARSKGACTALVKTEILKQGKIYTSEEQALIDLIKSSAQTAQTNVKDIIKLLNELRTTGWSDTKFGQMTTMKDDIAKLAKEVQDGKTGCVAHQGWRADGWTHAKAKQAVGPEANDELHESYLRIRKPMIDGIAETQPLVVKLKEYLNRAEDTVKTAQGFKPGVRADTAEVKKTVQTLSESAKFNSAKWKDNAAQHIKDMQEFVKLVSKDKKKVAPDKLKSAAGKHQAAEIWLTKSKAASKTLQVQVDNTVLLVKKSIVPPLQPEPLNTLKEASDLLAAAKASFKSVEDQWKIHKQKIDEAGARK